MRLLLAFAIITTLAIAAPASGKAADAANGTWSVDQQGESTQLELRWSNGTSHDTTEHSSSVDARELGIAQALASSGQHVRFGIQHEAGNYTLEGWIGNRKGGGTFTFTANTAFFSALRSRGYQIDSIGQEMACADLDITTAYVDGMESKGIHSEFGQLIAMKALDVTPDYLTELQTAGIDHLAAGELISLRALHVDGAYIRDLASVGFSHLAAGQYVSLKALHIDASYVRYLRSHGQKHLTVGQLITMKAMGI
jgi:hypothetical protein